MTPTRFDLSSWLLASGLALIFATRLRLPGLPLGIGELLLLVWLAGVVVSEMNFRQRSLLLDVKPFLVFWAVILVAMAIGYLNAVMGGIAAPANRAHDALAFAFCGLSSIAFLIWYRRRGGGEFPLTLALFLAVPLLLLWMVALRTEQIFGLELWSSYRFAGWSSNPNQTALALLLVPFLALHHANRRGPRGNHAMTLAAYLLSGLTVLAGWSVASSAGRLAWTICLPLLILALWLSTSGMDRRRALMRLGGGVAVVVILVAGNFLIGLESRSVRPEPKAASSDIATQVQGVFINKDSIGDSKISVRTSLARHAGDAILASHLLGYGPGSFSGIDAPLLGAEAHNALLDWGMSGGVLAMLALMALIAVTAYRLWKSGQSELLIGLLALAVFAQFHQVLRHPLVWIFLAYAWAEGDRGHRKPCAA